MIFVFVNEIKDLVLFNFIALVLQLFGIALILYYICIDLPSPISRKIIQKPTCWALFIARILGATEAVAVVSTIYVYIYIFFFFHYPISIYLFKDIVQNPYSINE